MTTPSQSLFLPFSVGIKTADGQSQGLLLDVSGMASSVSISKLDDSDITKVIYVSA